MIGTTLAAAGASLLLPTRSSSANVTLAAAAATGGRFYGSAVRIKELLNEDDFRMAVTRECAHVVPEFEMNWNFIEPAYGQMSFDLVDALADFSIQHNKEMRGHTLLWHLGTPDWAVAMLRERRDWTLIARYFASVIPRYGDVIVYWEVVNEPIETGHRPDGLRDSVFLEVFGPDYIGHALRQARTFAPHGKLMINEYGLEYALPVERDRRYALLTLLERLKAAGAPLDALGMQAHLDLSKGRVSKTAIDAFVREVTNLGLSIVITELDVKEADYTAPVEQRDRVVADEVRRYLDIVLPHPAVKGVTTWGLSDRRSWLEVTKEDYARFPGAWTDGSGPGVNRGLPLDASMQPKPMYYAMRDAFLTVHPQRQSR
jgi:endo-1,4-beta-xylanase